MANTVTVYVEDIDTQIAAGYTTIRLYAASSPEAIVTGAPVDTATLVAAQEEYELTDSSGTPSTWYAYDLFDGAAATGLSERWRTDATRLEELILETARSINRGFEGTCSAAGTQTTLVDAELLDSGVDVNFLEGAWIFRLDAAAAGDRVRRVAASGFNTSTGALTPSRSWTNAPADDERYFILGGLPPVDVPGATYSWAAAVNDGLKNCKWTDEINLGEGTAAGAQEFDLAAHLGYLGDPRKTVRSVWTATTVNGIEARQDWSKNGLFWRIIGNGPRDQKLWLSRAPGTTATVLAEVTRRGAALYDLSDTTTCPTTLAVAAAAVAALANLNGASGGEQIVELATAQRAFNTEMDFYGTRGLVRMD
jgi:hypothetical protein